MLKIYTDGACTGNGYNGAKAAWSFVVLEGDKVKHTEAGRVEGNQTNNVGELTGIKKALEYSIAHDDEGAIIYTDSEYSIHSITLWDIEKKVKGKQKKNYELIKEIKDLYFNSGLEFKLNWVRGHSEDYYNDMADRLANSACA